MIQQQLRHEDQVVNAAKRWTDEILPNWEQMYDFIIEHELHVWVEAYNDLQNECRIL